MTSTTTLLVSQDPSVIQEVQHLHDNKESASLEVCGRLEKVPARLGRGHTFLIVHCDSSSDRDRLRTLLEVADRMQVKAAIVWRPTDDRDTRAPDFGLFPVCRLPGDLPRLREL